MNADGRQDARCTRHTPTCACAGSSARPGHSTASAHLEHAKVAGCDHVAGIAAVVGLRHDLQQVPASRAAGLPDCIPPAQQACPARIPKVGSLGIVLILQRTLKLLHGICVLLTARVVRFAMLGSLIAMLLAHAPTVCLLSLYRMSERTTTADDILPITGCMKACTLEYSICS